MKKIKQNKEKLKADAKKVVRKTKEEAVKIKNKAKKAKADYDAKTPLEKKTFWNKILIVVLSIFILFFFLGFIFLIYVIFASPDFNPDNLYKKEASILYDTNNEVIATLGTEKREKVTYDELPEVLVDAIVATEDSRFFEHNGFDLPRFLKASLGQVLGNSGAGGASTITMQVSKNNFTSTNSHGIQGIIRKFTDIYMSVFKVEKHYTKEEILEFYVNAPYLGSGAYGVEQASQIFFGKHVNDLSLPEAATIAGLFQAPGAYDPYVYPEKATQRRNQVLSLMVRHGYISEEEAKLAKEVKIESLLVQNSEDGISTLNIYQGFIDTVAQEVIDKTGNNPYDVPMEIYTTMVREKQDAINALYNQETYTFVDDAIQLGISVIDNKTGAIVAVGAGRNKNRELGFNYATSTNKHPGSTAKPLFDYGPAFECMKWSTYGPVFDEPEVAYSNGTRMKNWDGGYEGMMTLKNALAESRNTTALTTFQAQTDKACRADFVRNLGIRAEFDENDKNYLHEAHAIGAFTGASPTELAAAYSAFASGGYYSEPYSFSKLVYRETGKEYTQKTKRERVMSEETAFMITDILVSATSNNSVKSTQVATKTGTSSYEEDTLKKYGVPTSAIQSSWVAFYSPAYSVSFWYGYDKLSSEHYLTMSSGSTQRNKIQRVLTKGITESGGKFTKPNGLSSVTVELETSPAALPSEYTPENLRETFLFFKGTEPTEVSERFTKLNAPSNLKITTSGSSATASWSAATKPNAADSTWLQNYFNTGYKKWATKYYNLRLEFNNAYIGEFGYEIYVKRNGSLERVGFTTSTSYTFNIPSGTTDVVVKSAYSIFKNNASEGIEKAVSEANQTDISCALNGNTTINKTMVESSSDTYDLSEITSPITVNYNGINVTASIANTNKTIKQRTSGNIITSIPLNTTGTYDVNYSFKYNDVTYDTLCPKRTVIVS